ncbi:MAG: hypothetical protein ACXWCP_29780 [Burkholderiales bacterium]
MSEDRVVSRQKKDEQKPIAYGTPQQPQQLSPPPASTTDVDTEDEMFEQELLEHYVGFVAGTPFVRPPHGK